MPIRRKATTESQENETTEQTEGEKAGKPLRRKASPPGDERSSETSEKPSDETQESSKTPLRRRSQSTSHSGETNEAPSESDGVESPSTTLQVLFLITKLEVTWGPEVYGAGERDSMTVGPISATIENENGLDPQAAAKTLDMLERIGQQAFHAKLKAFKDRAEHFGEYLTE